MSVIVWDGRTLAADCQATNCGLRYLVSKIRRLDDGTLLAYCGDQGSGEIMARWYESGAKLEEWPVSQKDKEDWSWLIVVKPDLTVISFERYPVPLTVLQVPAAWGSGRDFALGAMAMGADAQRAVEVANTYAEGCGLGVEAFDVAPLTLARTGD